MRAASSLGNGGSRGEMVLFQVSADPAAPGNKEPPPPLVCVPGRRRPRTFCCPRGVAGCKKKKDLATLGLVNGIRGRRQYG